MTPAAWITASIAAEALGRRGDGGAHLLEVADVGGGDQHLGAERLEPLHGADAPRRRVVRAVAAQVRVPARSRGGSGARPTQHEPRAASARQRLGDAQADAAEAAGDQADAARRAAPVPRPAAAASGANSSSNRLPPRSAATALVRRREAAPRARGRRARRAGRPAPRRRPSAPEAGRPLDGGQRRRRAAGR